MIIFYNNKTRRIYGSVSGRVHTDEELKASVQPSGVPKSEIGKKGVDIKQIQLEGHHLCHNPL